MKSEIIDGLKVITQFGANDVPMDMQNELQHLGDLGEAKAWGVAKRVTFIVEGLSAEGFEEIPMMKLYAAVGQWCKSGSETVRSYYGVYKEIPTSIFVQYTGEEPSLSFHQFKALVPVLRDKDEYAWGSKIMEWYATCEEGNRSAASVDGLRAWLGLASGGSPQIGRHQRVYAQALKLSTDETVPLLIRRIYERFIKAMDIAIDRTGQREWRINE